MLPDGAKTVRKVFLKKGECQEKCFGVVGVARKVFLGRPAKIKGQTLLTILPPSAAIKSEQNLRGFYQRQSQLTGGQVLGPTILPPAGVRGPLTTFTQS